MRPLTFGVLVSPPVPAGRWMAPSATIDPGLGGDDPRDRQRFDRTLEGMVDLRSGSDLAEALRSLGFHAKLLAADDDLDLALRSTDVDACLLALHGRTGGSGDVQALLTMRSVPFCGPAGTATALAFDKVRSRQVLAYHNLPVPAALALGGGRKASDKALELLGWPCVVKPRRGALGLGVAALVDPEQVEVAIGRALDLDREVVLERACSGLEVQVVLLGDRVLGAMEVHRRPLEDLLEEVSTEDESSFTSHGDWGVCPPRLPRGRLDGIYNLARRAVGALGLQDGLSRVDVMVGDRYNELILEVEPLPPLHRDGVVARVARAAGFAYEELVVAIMDRLVLRAPSRSVGERPLLQ
jgi:D-alanine-D-alanine ligase